MVFNSMIIPARDDVLREDLVRTQSVVTLV